MTQISSERSQFDDSTIARPLERLSCNDSQSFGRDNDFAVGNEDAIAKLAIPASNNTVAGILSNRMRNEVGRHSKDFRHLRRLLIPHSPTPRHVNCDFYPATSPSSFRHTRNEKASPVHYGIRSCSDMKHCAHQVAQRSNPYNFSPAENFRALATTSPRASRCRLALELQSPSKQSSAWRLA